MQRLEINKKQNKNNKTTSLIFTQNARETICKR